MVTQHEVLEGDMGNGAGGSVVVHRQHLNSLFEVLSKCGYTVVGPTVRDAAIVCAELGAVEELPAGWTDEQEGGSYRLQRRQDDALFGYVVGPESWKKFLHPPSQRLLTIGQVDGDLSFSAEEEAPPRYAFVGVRPCELAAIAIQDRVFLDGEYVDPNYRSRRNSAFTVAVNCGEAGGNCFCVSMDSGPAATSGYDLVMTEVLDADAHYFVTAAGSDRGKEVLAELPHEPATAEAVELATKIVAAAASQMGRSLDRSGIQDLLYRNREHSRWDRVAERCLGCANCTMVCPTCFCTTTEERTDLNGAGAERWRHWDSCFTMDFSFIHGGSVRESTRGRYRHWMTHKLASWIDQFGTCGCVGCGRCITWCPAGIDITEEVEAVRAGDIGPVLSVDEETERDGDHGQP